MHFQITEFKLFLGKGALPLTTPACSHITSSQGIGPSKMLIPRIFKPFFL